MRIILASLFLLFFFAGSSPAQTAQSCQGVSITPGSPTSVVCSNPFYFNGFCGTPVYPTAPSGWADVALYVNPWESSSITILKAKVTVTSIMVTGLPAVMQYPQFFVGNSFNPDPVTAIEDLISPSVPLASFSVSSPSFPSGTGMQFPAPGVTGFSGPHLDVHLGACSPIGMYYWGFLTVWYTVP